MATVDTLVTKYQMDNRDYVRGASQVDDATMRNQRNMEGLARGIRGATTIMTGFVAGIGAATTALIALGTASVQRSAQFDAMVKALEAIEGSAKGASDAIKSLREIAARPGLGLEEAIQGYSGLRRAGLDREMSMRVLAGAGNANALAGGGREELSRILTAITQIAMKPNLSGEELMQLNEGGIAASRIIGDAFGTFDGGELKKMGVDSRDALEALVQGMEDMPQAASSAKNSLENLGMAWDMALVGIGQGLTTHLIGPMEDLAGALAKLDEDGSFKIIGDQLGAVTMSAFPNLQGTTESLDEQMFELSLVVLDVAEALRNMKLNIDDAVNPIKTGVGVADHLTGGAISEAFGTNIRTARENAIMEREQREHALAESNRRARELGYKDRDEMMAAREGGKKDGDDDGKDPFGAPNMQLRYLADIERNTAVTARALNAFTLGGSAIGEDAFNSVNINRFTQGQSRPGDFAQQLAGVIQTEMMRMITRNNGRVGV